MTKKVMGQLRFLGGAVLLADRKIKEEQPR